MLYFKSMCPGVGTELNWQLLCPEFGCRSVHERFPTITKNTLQSVGMLGWHRGDGVFGSRQGQGRRSLW